MPSVAALAGLVVYGIWSRNPNGDFCNRKGMCPKSIKDAEEGIAALRGITEGASNNIQSQTSALGKQILKTGQTKVMP